MFWVVVLIDLRVHKTYLAGLFKKFRFPASYPGIASGGMGCGPGVVTFINSGSEPTERTASSNGKYQGESTILYCLEASGHFVPEV